MAAKAIVAERQSIALAKIREHVKAITPSLGIDPIDLDEHIAGGDAPYKEMVRTEQMEALLRAVREKVATPAPEPEPAGFVPVRQPPAVSPTRPAESASFSDIDGSRKPRKPHK